MPLDTCAPCDCQAAYIKGEEAFRAAVLNTLCAISIATSSDSIGIQGYILCDNNVGPTTSTPFIRMQIVMPDLTVVIVDTTLDGLTPYITTGTVAPCEENFEQEILCYEEILSLTAHNVTPLPGFAPFNSWDMISCVLPGAGLISSGATPINNIAISPDQQYIYTLSSLGPPFFFLQHNLATPAITNYTLTLSGLTLPTEVPRGLEYDVQSNQLGLLTVDSVSSIMRFYLVNEATAIATLIGTSGTVTVNSAANALAITNDGNIYVHVGLGTFHKINPITFADTFAFTFLGGVIAATGVEDKILVTVSGVEVDLLRQDGSPTLVCPFAFLQTNLAVSGVTTQIVQFIRSYIKQADGSSLTQDTDLNGNLITLPDTATICTCPVEIKSSCTDPVIVKTCCPVPTGVVACYSDPATPPFEQVDTYTPLAPLDFLNVAIPPEEATYMEVFAWGAGGGAGFGAAAASLGGGGGFVQGTFPAHPVLVAIGEGGAFGTPLTNAFPNGGSGGFSTLGEVGGGGGGSTGLLWTDNRWLMQAGAGGGGGGSTATAGNGGAGGFPVGQDGTAGTGPLVGAGGQGGQLTIGGAGGIIGVPGSDGEPASSAFFFGYQGGDGGSAVAPLEGSGGGGGGGATAGGSGNGRAPGGGGDFDASGGGGGSCFVDPAAINPVCTGGFGAVPANTSSPYYVAGHGVGGSGAAGGDGLLVIRWFNEGGLRKAEQFQICNPDGSSSFEWRDVITKVQIDPLLLVEDCLEPICETPIISLAPFSTFSITINDPSPDLTVDTFLSPPGTTDGSPVITLLQRAENVQTNGWGPPPAGPFPANPGNYSFAFSVPITLPWVPGNESYYLKLQFIFGYELQYLCETIIYVPQFEATSPTDTSGFYFQNTRDGIWRDFSQFGLILTGFLDCLEAPVSNDAQLVKVCNLEPFLIPIILCDDQGGGNVIPFLRKYRATSTLIGSGFIDYTLDGTTPYDVLGNPILCSPPQELVELQAANITLTTISTTLSTISTDTLDCATDNVGACLSTNSIVNGFNVLTPLEVAIDVSALGDNTLIAGVPFNAIRVLTGMLVVSDAVTIRFESGAGGTALTGQQDLIANQEYILPFSPIGHFTTGVGALLNLELSAAVQVGGYLKYILIP